MGGTKGRMMSFKRTGSRFAMRNGWRIVKEGFEGVKGASLSVMKLV